MAAQPRVQGDPIEALSAPDRCPPALALAALVVYSLVAAAAAAIEVLLIPLRIGTTIIPVTVLLGGATTVLVPILARRVCDTFAASLLPVLAWSVVVIGSSVTGPGGDVLVPGGTTALVTVFYAFVAVGFVAGVAGIIRATMRQSDDYARRP